MGLLLLILMGGNEKTTYSKVQKINTPVYFFTYLCVLWFVDKKFSYKPHKKIETHHIFSNTK